MADIVIRGYKMPCNCGGCDFFFENSLGAKWCGIKHTPTEGAGRPEWCPLIALPEGHGDLIERTYPLKRMRETLWNWRAKAKEAVPVISGYIKDAPTIVPAEKEEKKHVEV